MSGQVLPEGWHWVRLGDICQTETEIRDPRQMPDTPFKYVDIASVNNQTKVIESWRELLGRDAPSRARKVIRSEDVIVATTRPYLNAIAYVPAELDGEICSTGFCVLRAVGEVTPRFLFAFVQTRSFIDQVSGRMRGASYPAVSDKDVFAVSLPLPPLDEQRRIVARLEALQAGVEKAEAEIEAAVEKAERLWGGILASVFKRGEREGWPKKQLGDCIESIRYGTGSPPEYVETGIRFIRATNIKEGRVVPDGMVFIAPADAEKLTKCKVSAGNLILVRSGVNTGDCACVPPEYDGAYAAYDLIIEVRADHSAELLNCLLASPSVRRQIDRLKGRSAQPHINAQQAQKLEFFVPPTYQEQLEVLDHLNRSFDQIEALRQEQAAMREKLSRLQASLLDTAFRGEL